MPKKALETIANPGPVLTKSGFKNYDACINSYVGCEFGCSYCYVRWLVKDKELPWGEFVRIRSHIATKLPKELLKGTLKIDDGKKPVIMNGHQVLDEAGKPLKEQTYKVIPITSLRVVLGTMVDPWQPKEAKHRITRTVLQTLLRDDLPRVAKVGAFTRSPLVLQDLDLITRLPKRRIHFTVTPYKPSIMRKLEPYAPLTERRWDTIKKLKEAGIRVHVNIAPVMPTLSESLMEEWIGKVAELQADEFFIDPMQPYKESFESFKQALKDEPGVKWSEIEKTMLDREAYLDWKAKFYEMCHNIWHKVKHLAPNQLPIWSDHENHVWIDMRTRTQMNPKMYGDAVEG